MLLLTSTSDVVRIVTGAASDIHVHASYMDNASGTITPGRANTLITTATTTTVVSAPGSSTQRNVKNLTITNNSGSSPTSIAVEHFNGTTASELIQVDLLPGENLLLDAIGNWSHRDAQGGLYPAVQIVDPWSVYGINNTISESIPRVLAGVNLSALTSGTLFMQSVYLRAGQRIANITFCSGTTAAGTPTNQFFALYSASRVLLAQTANATTTAWTANTVVTRALTASYTVPTTGLYYVGIMVAATTVPSLVGMTAAGNAAVRSAAPILSGNSSTGLTTALPDPAAAITGGVNAVWTALT